MNTEKSKIECEYCYNTVNKFKNKPMYDNWSIYLSVFRKNIIFSYADSYSGEQVKSIEINFCPMCGEKLEKYSEEDEFEV